MGVRTCACRGQKLSSALVPEELAIHSFLRQGLAWNSFSSRTSCPWGPRDLRSLLLHHCNHKFVPWCPAPWVWGMEFRCSRWHRKPHSNTPSTPSLYYLFLLFLKLQMFCFYLFF